MSSGVNVVVFSGLAKLMALKLTYNYTLRSLLDVESLTLIFIFLFGEKKKTRRFSPKWYLGERWASTAS